MKRESITAIIQKAVLLDCDAVIYGIKFGSTYSKSAKRIMKAATNEIIRLEAAENLRQFKAGYSEGYESGFECATIAAESIVKCSKRFDEIDQETPAPATSQDLADTSNSAGVPGPSLAEPFDMICNTLKNIPGSGYEFLNKK